MENLQQKKDLIIRHNSDFKQLIRSINETYKEEDNYKRQLILTSFIQKCCPMLMQILTGHIIEERHNFFNSNQIKLNLAAALLTTYSLLDERFKLFQAPDLNSQSRVKNLNHKEQTKFKSILCELKKDFAPKEGKIEIGAFIKWIMTNSKDFPRLSEETWKYYNSFADCTIWNMRHYFIYHALLRMVLSALYTGWKLNSLEPSSVIKISENQFDYTSDDLPYSEKITKFAASFNPKRLRDIECEGKNDLSKFGYIVENGLRWFAQIGNDEARHSAGYHYYPEIIYEDDKKIMTSLKLAPFYKLVKLNSSTGEPANYEIMLKNTGKITVETDSILEFPEELGFLAAHYGYYIRLTLNKNNSIIKKEITLNNIVIPGMEAEKLKQIINDKAINKIPQEQKDAIADENSSNIVNSKIDCKTENEVSEHRKNGKKGGRKSKYNFSLQAIIDNEVSAHGRGCTAFKKMMEDYTFESFPARDDLLYESGYPTEADDLYVLDGKLHFKDNSRPGRPLSLPSLNRYFGRANKKDKEKPLRSAEAN